MPSAATTVLDVRRTRMQAPPDLVALGNWYGRLTYAVESMDPHRFAQAMANPAFRLVRADGDCYCYCTLPFYREMKEYWQQRHAEVATQNKKLHGVIIASGIPLTFRSRLLDYADQLKGRRGEAQQQYMKDVALTFVSYDPHFDWFDPHRPS